MILRRRSNEHVRGRKRQAPGNVSAFVSWRGGQRLQLIAACFGENLKIDRFRRVQDQLGLPFVGCEQDLIDYELGELIARVFEGLSISAYVNFET